MLGNREFCPTVRRTDTLETFTRLKLDEEAAQLVRSYEPEILRRAVNYLYTKETRSSFKIEGETPDHQRAARFVELLSRVDDGARLDEAELTRLQNAIVLPGSEAVGYRAEPVYIAEQLDLVRQYIHYVAPRHEDIPAMMEGWARSFARMAGPGVPAIVQAAAVSFGFVFIHPFSDGNGRIHRLLIHRVLSRAKFTPKDVVLPVSAVILQRRGEYDSALESISKPLMRFVEYDEEEDGKIAIRNQTAPLYRYIDYTRVAEDLARWTERTVRTELRSELEFVSRYREAKAGIEEVTDLPDRLMNLFIQVVAKNGGRLSRAKRHHFARQSDEQILRMEHAVRAAFGIPEPAGPEA